MNGDWSRIQRRAFYFALGLHGLGFLLLVVLPFLPKWEKREELHVFEIVAPPANLPLAPEQGPIAPTPPKPLNLPRPEQLKPVPDIPTPEPEPAPTPPPKPSPTPPKAEPPPPTPAPAPAPQSYEEWVKNRKLPEKTVTPQPAPARQPVNVPRVNTQIREQLREAVSGLQVQNFTAGNAAEADEMNLYRQRLNAVLQAAFEGSGRNLSAKVSFQVTASGQFTNVVIVRSSGDEAFDLECRRVFQRARPPGPPPGRVTRTFQTDFNSEN